MEKEEKEKTKKKKILIDGDRVYSSVFPRPDRWCVEIRPHKSTRPHLQHKQPRDCNSLCPQQPPKGGPIAKGQDITLAVLVE